MWMRCARWMQIASSKAHQSSGPESTRSPSQARAKNEEYVNAISDLPRDTWTLRERPIFIGCTIVKSTTHLHWTARSSSDMITIVIGRLQLIAIMAHQRRTRGRIWTHLNAAMAIRRQKPDDHATVAHDHEIVAHDHKIGRNPILRSWETCGAFDLHQKALI